MTQSDAQPVSETTASTSQSEKHPKKPFSLRKTLRSVLITILSVLCIIGGVLIHKLHSKGMAAYPTFKRTEATRPALMVPSVMLTPTPKPILDSETDVSDEQPITISSMATPPSTTDKARHLADDIADEFATLSPASDTPSDTADLSLISSDEPKAITPSPLPATEKQPPSITRPLLKNHAVPLNAVLKLQHDFYHTASCRNAFDVLQSKVGDDLKARQVVVDLSAFCAEPGSAKKRLKTLFLKDKKQGLYAYYHQSHAPWYAYVRALLIDLIDVHEINPKGETPPELIDRAQTAIDQGNIAEALRILTALPFELKAEFASFFREAAAFVRAEESLKALILSYEKQGE